MGKIRSLVVECETNPAVFLCGQAFDSCVLLWREEMEGENQCCMLFLDPREQEEVVQTKTSRGERGWGSGRSRILLETCTTMLVIDGVWIYWSLSVILIRFTTFLLLIACPLPLAEAGMSLIGSPSQWMGFYGLGSTQWMGFYGLGLISGAADRCTFHYLFHPLRPQCRTRSTSDLSKLNFWGVALPALASCHVTPGCVWSRRCGRHVWGGHASESQWANVNMDENTGALVAASGRDRWRTVDKQVDCMRIGSEDVGAEGKKLE